MARRERMKPKNALHSGKHYKQWPNCLIIKRKVIHYNYDP